MFGGNMNYKESPLNKLNEQKEKLEEILKTLMSIYPCRMFG